jgi:tRNA-uridine 2-sulfurtransferase
VKVLVAMSGGVDSSVAAALLARDGHEVVGATMKLWGGASDSGCCSVSDVEDARRVAQQLGIVHHVFNFGDEFMENVVGAYVDAHAKGLTPNPCVECNRHVKFDKFIDRAKQLGFDAIATGHHARIENHDGVWKLLRGEDQKKDQSYVLHMLDQEQLSRTMLPVGNMTKTVVRELAAELGLRTATKPDSQDVCFITSQGGRSGFLGDRIPLKSGRIVDSEGNEEGLVDAVQLMTIGQRKGIGVGGHGEKRYVTDVDVATSTVTIGPQSELMRDNLSIGNITFTHESVEPGTRVLVQTSAHGEPQSATFLGDRIEFDEPQRRVAPGQSVVFYEGDSVLGGAIAG